MFHPAEAAHYHNAAPIAESPARQAMAVGAMFAAACHGAMPLTRSLAALRQLAHADDLTLVREVLQDKCYLIATTAAQNTVLEPQTAAWAAHLGKQAGTMVPGHVITHPARADQVAIVLMTDARFVDLLIVRGGARHLLSDFGAVAPAIWAGRRTGLAIAAITDLLRLARSATESEGRAAEQTPVVERLLSAQNPAGLTPAEFRVAICLKEGLKPMAIGERLEISMPTVRTHLRNIYAKTGLDGMSAVLHRLHIDAA